MKCCFRDASLRTTNISYDMTVMIFLPWFKEGEAFELNASSSRNK